MISAVIVGPKGATKIELVFDSGAAITQVHIGTLKAIGFSFTDKIPDLQVRGVTGHPEDDFSCVVERLHLLGIKHRQVPIAAFDFSDWAESGIDGLLGWDLIQKMHFEMDGPEGGLKIFDSSN